VSAILYPIAANADAALRDPRGRAVREREAERVAGEPVAFAREFTGPSFKNEDEARAHYAGRLDDERPGSRTAIAPEDRFCDLKPIIQRSRVPFTHPHTVWRLSVGYWRIGEAHTADETPQTKTSQARKARREKSGEAPDAETLEAMANQPLQPIKPQKALDIGLFEVRLPENPGIIVADE
jgi:hypothetical protein